MSRKLLVFLTDPLSAFFRKGEVRCRYYNPLNFFSEVHFVSPADREIEAERVQALVGDARLVIHPLGGFYYGAAWFPFGALASLLKCVGPDVLRAYDPAVRGSLAVYWGKRLGVPSLVSVHADLDEQRRYERRFLHRLRAVFERYTLTRADAVMCVSHHVAHYAKRHGVRDPIVIYNRVYTDEFGADAVPPRSERRDVTILCVGRLVSQKYQECLIRAVRGLDARLVLIGDGVLRGLLERLVNELGMDSQVAFWSAIPHSQIPREYRDADIFAIATHYEGFCIPVLEAMAAGLPVVASRIAPIEEIVGDAGFLVENQPAAFAATLGRLVTDAALRQEMGTRAAERARTMDGHIMEEREYALYARWCG